MALALRGCRHPMARLGRRQAWWRFRERVNSCKVTWLIVAPSLPSTSATVCRSAKFEPCSRTNQHNQPQPVPAVPKGSKATMLLQRDSIEIPLLSDMVLSVLFMILLHSSARSVESNS